MSKPRVPLGLRGRVSKPKPLPEQIMDPTPSIKKEAVAKKKTPKKGKGRPSTKKGKQLVKYSMDIHPELKRAVVKAAAIYDKEVHVMWNEIIFDWLSKEQKKHPEWYSSIKVNKTEL